MADEKFISRGRVKKNPSTGTIRGDVSKFVLNPLKDLFTKEKEDVAKYETEIPKIKLSSEAVEKVINKFTTDQK